MKVYQWDGSNNEITIPVEVSDMDVAALEELMLRERMYALNHRVEVEVESWASPSELIGCNVTANGTWMASGKYDRDYGFVLAANPGDDSKALADMTQFVIEELKEYDDPPGMPDDIDLGDVEEQEPSGLPNFVACNVEEINGEQAVGWFAYFRSEPTPEDLEAAREFLHHAKPASEIFDVPDLMSNALSIQLGLVRFYVAGVI